MATRTTRIIDQSHSDVCIAGPDVYLWAVGDRACTLTVTPEPTILRVVRSGKWVEVEVVRWQPGVTVLTGMEVRRLG